MKDRMIGLQFLQFTIRENLGQFNQKIGSLGFSVISKGLII
jgi:hypothetical protein